MDISRNKLHHLTDLEMFALVKSFLKESLPGNFTNEEVWSTTILIYPSYGIVKERKIKKISE